MTEETKNPFQVALREQAALGEVEQSRAIAQVQAAMIMAKRFPRDYVNAIDRILNACTRPGLAEEATYNYNRGGTPINEPSIRLAEVLAQNWGNIEFGILELEQGNGQSVMQSFAWDLETNVKQLKTFTVRHERHTKHGVTKLTDPRDIYEMTANLGARRLRACILGIIPRDVTEAAVEQCELTLNSTAQVTPESLAKLLEAFAPFDVTKQQIEKRIQRHLDTMLPQQLVGLRKIFNSLKDGMSKPSDWFESIESIPEFVETKKKKEKLEAPKAASGPMETLRMRLIEHAIGEDVFCEGLTRIGYEIEERALDQLPASFLKQLADMDFNKLLDKMEAKANA